MKHILLYFEKVGKRKLILIAFIICLIPRVILTAINTDANDDHITPIMLWMEWDAYPEKGDCWECFQPPFYYGIIKSIAEISGAVSQQSVQKIFQWVNFIPSVGCLLLIFLLQFKSNLPFRWNLSLALFWGLNPKLIAISVQATNDIVIITLGMLFTWLLLMWVENKKTVLFLLILLTVFIAGIIKGNGLVLFIILGLVLIAIMAKGDQKSSILISMLLLMLLLPAIGYFGNYYHKYLKHNDPFVTNMDKSNTPNWFIEDTIYGGRKGVITIWDSFFTFRLLSLLEQPYVINETKTDYPLHRTSFFTQLYGQFSNSLFERWPWKWVCRNNDMQNFSRVNYLVQVPLLLLFIWGVIVSLRPLFREWKQSDVVYLSVFFIYLLFALKYSYDIRDYGNMKVIFIFPAMLTMIYFFQKGIGLLKSRTLNMAALILVNFSTLLYVVNLTYFHLRLFSNLD
jgi:hypothetical protein